LPFDRRRSDQHQAPNQLGPGDGEPESYARTEAQPQHVDLAQAQVSGEVGHSGGRVFVVPGRRRIRLPAPRQIGRVRGAIVRDLRQKSRKRAT